MLLGWLFLLPQGNAQTSTKVGAASAENFSFRPRDPATLTGFDHFYNLEYDAAVHDFEQVMRRHPDDPFAVNHLLTAVLFHELYRMGVLNTGEYANDSFIKAPHRPADPKVEAQIKDLVEKALAIEQRGLGTSPNSTSLLYSRGVTRAQFATYTALMDTRGSRHCAMRWGRGMIMSGCWNYLPRRQKLN